MYEIHLTIAEEHGLSAQLVASRIRGWTTSAIDGDALLGRGTKVYLTAHSKIPQAAFDMMNTMNLLLRDAGVPVLRSKVELILYDTKTGIGVPAT